MGEGIRDFADLEIYQTGYKLALMVYQVSQSLPETERYGLLSQMRRAAVSIPANIAEGYGRRSSAAEFKNFLRMALGSANEMVVLLSLTKDLGYTNQGKVQEVIQAYDSLGKQIYRLMQVWK